MGDNEYNDSPDPEGNFAEWKDNFLYFDQNWTHDIDVMHQDIRPENFAFVIQDTLFMGFNMVGSWIHDADEWAERTADNLAWLQYNFEQFGATTSNAVLFEHADMGRSGYEVFETGFLEVAQDYDKPIVYFMGDLHKWSVSNPYDEAPNVTRVVVDKTTEVARVLEVGVTDDTDDPFVWDHGVDSLFG